MSNFERPPNFLEKLIDDMFDFLDQKVGPNVRPVPGAKSRSASERE